MKHSYSFRPLFYFYSQAFFVTTFLGGVSLSIAMAESHKNQTKQIETPFAGPEEKRVHSEYHCILKKGETTLKYFKYSSSKGLSPIKTSDTSQEEQKVDDKFPFTFSEKGSMLSVTTTGQTEETAIFIKFGSSFTLYLPEDLSMDCIASEEALKRLCQNEWNNSRAYSTPRSDIYVTPPTKNTHPGSGFIIGALFEEFNLPPSHSNKNGAQKTMIPYNSETETKYQWALEIERQILARQSQGKHLISALLHFRDRVEQKPSKEPMGGKFDDFLIYLKANYNDLHRSLSERVNKQSAQQY